MTLQEKNFSRKVVGCVSHVFYSHAQKTLWAAGLVMSLMLSVAPSLYAESSGTKEPLIEHLEFLGYECDVIEAGIRAKHISKIHLFITNAYGGIRIQTGFPGKMPRQDEPSRYVITNALMRQLAVVQLYWSDEGSLLSWLGCLVGMRNHGLHSFWKLGIVIRPCFAKITKS